MRILTFKKFESEMQHTKASNTLLEEFVGKFSDFEETNINEFVGYKVVDKINLNYYSVVTGLFRYQPGKIDHKSYSVLYKKNPEYYNEHLLNRLAIFTDKQDAIDSLIEAKNYLKDYKYNKLALMEITISGNIEKAKFSNNYVQNKEVYIGDTIEKVKEVEILT